MEYLPILVIVFIGLMIVMNSVRVLREYERGVVFRVGRLIGEAALAAIRQLDLSTLAARPPRADDAPAR